MSHEITRIDRQQGIEQAWHGLTQVLPEIKLSESWLAQWDVTKTPLYVMESGVSTKTDYCQIVASDNPKIRIGAPVHGETYQPITNKDFLDLISEAIRGIKGVKIASVGSVCGRGRVFVSIKLSELECFKAARREFKAYLNFLNSHDQSSAFLANTSNTCTVCNNTFGMNLHAKKGETGMRVRLKHTKNVGLRLENIPALVDGFLGAQAEFRAIMDSFDQTPIQGRHARAFFAGFLNPDLPAKPTREQAEISGRKANQIDRLTTLFSRGNGNRGETLADVFSAVTDYYSHESSGGEDMERQFVSSEFGTGQAHKARAWSILQNKEAINQTVIAGHYVLAYN